MLWKNVLLLYDGASNGERAIEWTSNMFGGVSGIKITVLGLHEAPPRHDFKDESPIVGKLERQIASMLAAIESGRTGLAKAKNTLMKAGLPEEAISIKFKERKDDAVSEIKQILTQGDIGTIVVGRGGTPGAMLLGGGAVKELTAQLPEYAFCVI